MKIVLAGPGAIGCFFGVRLARSGQAVWLLDHDAARARRLAAGGIRLESGGVGVTVPVRATSHSPDAGVADVVFICVKAYQTAAAVERAAGCVGQATVVVSLQNGFGNDEQIARRVAADRIVNAVTSWGVTRLAEGVVREAGAGRTGLAPFVPQGRDAAAAVAGILAQAGFEVALGADPRTLRWGKLVINAAVNPVTALWNVPNGALIERPELFEVAAQAAAEAARVAAALGVSLPYADPALELRAVCSATRENISSMCQDVRRGLRTEIDAINGAVIRQARECCVSTPVNEDLAARVRGLGKGFKA